MLPSKVLRGTEKGGKKARHKEGEKEGHNRDYKPKRTCREI